MKALKEVLVFLLATTVSMSLVSQGEATEPSMSDYTAYPIFMSQSVKPNILIILDNSGSMNFNAYGTYPGDGGTVTDAPYSESTAYYGYFDSDARYTYRNGRFERDSNGEWNGNWLNWLCMRRIDVARKVLVGGLATSRTGGGNTTLIGETPAQSTRWWKRWFDASLATPYVSPYHGNYCYSIKGGYIYVDTDGDLWNGYTARYEIKVKKVETEEPDLFVDGNIAGILQRVGDKARFGLEFYNSDQGGYIASRVDSGNITDITTRIENKGADTWTPLAEAFYEGVRYFQQVRPYYFNSDYTTNNTMDPFYWNDIGDFVECQKSFVLLITDGESTQDRDIPSDLRDYDNDGNDPGSYSSNGSDYLDDVALWAHINDLRSDLSGTQNITFYPVFAFGHGSSLLKDAAKNGGFIDKNENNIPDLDSEWDSDGNGIPDTYFEAENGFELEAKLLEAITDILRRAASGTAVSVLATSGEGEGNLVQAYFRPVITTGLTEVKWVGYLQSLWVDPFGNLREDTDQDRILDVEKDNVISYFVDTGTGDTKIKRFTVSQSNPYPDVESDPYEVVELSDINPIWEAGKLLADRSPSDRKIFTYVDKNKNSHVDESTDDPFDQNGEVVSFTSASASILKPYLGVKDGATWSYLGPSHDERVLNLISYIRGNDVTGLRSRTINGEVWKLGDIVHSTPVVVSKPVENYQTIYSDESYQTYYDAFKERETIVYVGANDGMLHAFTSWQYDASSGEYKKPSGASGTEEVGDELWAYIPQALLAHLKWLASPDYTHVYYVDLKPKVFDAKILDDDMHYIDTDSDPNWGTFLLCGLRMGGKHIWSQGDYDDGSGTIVSETRDFYPTYFCIDITDPRKPRLLWERSYSDLQMSMSIPAIVKVKDNWFAVFGSGPSDYDGTSSKKGHVFVVDLKTGNPYKSGTNDWLFETSENKAFMNSPVSFDMGLNYNVDAVYFGETYLQESNWKGKIYKVTVPWADSEHNYDGTNLANYVDNPLDWTNPWIFSALFDAQRPITAPIALSMDLLDNVWLYVGSGRYLAESDKTNSDTQYMFGVKDPFFNADHRPIADGGLYGTNYYHNYGTTLELSTSDLFDADPYIVAEGGAVYEDSTLIGNFQDLISLARAKNGWFRTLSITGERVTTKSAILGGIVLAPSFVPSDDICGFGGDSYLYGLYFETGTAYYEPVFTPGTQTVVINGEETQQVLDKIQLGPGKASAVGIHVGSEGGAKGLIQQSTGTIVTQSMTPPLNIKSGLRSWREKWGD